MSELGEQRHAHLIELLAGCPGMAVLAELVSGFARIVTEHRGRDLDDWMSSARAASSWSETRRPPSKVGQSR
ncbi:hypothetical protein [Nocardia fusca]|uniref:hypothetical protein n=1 Tax=Nocardia fusca TaxID=941183 RepID=UPI0007A732B6|nr:hypothetical protein [Nocardia fusca]